jgi:hypothetical protein
MWPSIAITLFLSALFITAFRFRRDEQLENIVVLRHTINVNLNILDNELSELKTIALATPDSAAQQQASKLLRKSQVAAEAARARVENASTEELGKILGMVFGAMSQSTDARRLLTACIPR